MLLRVCDAIDSLFNKNKRFYRLIAGTGTDQSILLLTKKYFFDEFFIKETLCRRLNMFTRRIKFIYLHKLTKIYARNMKIEIKRR